MLTPAPSAMFFGNVFFVMKWLSPYSSTLLRNASVLTIPDNEKLVVILRCGANHRARLSISKTRAPDERYVISFSGQSPANTAGRWTTGPQFSRTVDRDTVRQHRACIDLRVIR